VNDSIATVLKQGGPNYKYLQHSSTGCCTPNYSVDVVIQTRSWADADKPTRCI